MNRPAIALAAAALAAAALAAKPETPATTFEQENAAWRAWRLERLTSPTGWVSLIGLHWLQEGDNPLGSASGGRFALPADRAPERLGVLRLVAGEVTLIPEPGAGLTADEAAATAPIVLATDADESPTRLAYGSLDMYVVRRGDRLGLRVRDAEARLRKEFPGLDYFPADPAYRVEARFTPNPPGSTLEVANVLGTIDPVPSPGRLDFELLGGRYSLTALDDTGDGRLFLIVGDRTNGYDTYGAGRYLYADPPVDGVTVVDFNRLYNPPCAFTAYSTCQLPPRENKLPLRIEAGEKKFVLEAQP
jgi:uncharacterized protein (DUF1684 family)